MSELSPTPPRERLISLDVLRGFALCGVAIGNMVLYSGRWADSFATPEQVGPLDQAARLVIAIFVDSKAQTLLMLLFGLGFAAQLLRAERTGAPVMGLYVRRLVALFLLGALHVTVLWWGDVTWTYAIAGLGLLAFLRTSNRVRIGFAVGFTFVPFLAWNVPAVFIATHRVFYEPRAFVGHTARMAAALHSPSHAGLPWEHMRYALVWAAHIYSWYFFWAVGRFLVGYVAGKLRWFDRDGADHLDVFRRLARWGGCIAAATTAVAILERFDVISLRELGLPGSLVVAAIDQIGILSLVAAYVGIVVLGVQRPRSRRVLAVVAPVGRMPLTVYFSQSLVATFLFYGWGLGWAGSVGIAGDLALALAIFGLQIVACHLWLHWFRFGPLEWLWRSVTYLELPPMRVRAD